MFTLRPALVVNWGPASTRGPVISLQYRCPGGKAVESLLLKDIGHTWPGGQRGFRGADDPTSSLHATDVIWNFFRAQAK